MTDMILKQYEAAKSRRSHWESLWKECYAYALPQRESFDQYSVGGRKTDHIYDGTAMDAVEQLAASLLGQLTPPWSSWFGFKPGPEMSESDAESLAPALEKAARLIQSHFDRSNFAVEMHQAFLDLVTGGTATLHFEEAQVGGYSAFRFQTIPLSQTVLEEGARTGRLDGIYREVDMTLEKIALRFPDAEISQSMSGAGARDKGKTFQVLETVLPENLSYRYKAYLLNNTAEPTVLREGLFADAPYISFRWMKAPGEIYGRSPVMKSLPDIKTANKVVELILKNASIAVSGIWQADDDGVLNPANIKLSPGTIIPKAVGSKGLTPLEMPGRFDVSQIIIDDLRSRIRHSMMVDRLGAIGQTQMTATEVLERSSEMALLLGATYGRLQSELLTPLIHRAYAILRRRGEVPDIDIDGRLVALDYRSPLALAQGQKNVQNTLYWINTALSLGPEAAATIDLPAAARHLGEALGVPSDLIRKQEPDMAVLAQKLTENLNQNQPLEGEIDNG
ncbi:MAG: phage tail protein [Alphaproteobacteria bacterium]|nr:MAG: phage tail protein [Alphaproteobacteria bacterium]